MADGEQRSQSSLVLGYGGAFASGVAILALARFGIPLDLPGTPSVLFLALVMLSAWYGGLGPGLLTVGLGTGLVLLQSSLLTRSSAHVIGLALFVAEAALVAWLTQRARSAGGRSGTAVDRARTGSAGREPSEAARRVVPRTMPEAHALTDDFLAVLSHELRAPLSTILGWARLLRGTQADQEMTARALEAIERSVRGQTALLDDLGDLARLLTGRLQLEVRPVELAPLIVHAIETIRPEADAKAVRLDTVLDPQPDPVSGDPERLQQILWNLVSNAVRSTPAGGRVQVRLECPGRGVEVRVTDTGPGLAPELLPHVFDHLRQTEGATSPGGLGLGLAIARRLTELHGGALRADSPGIGRGTTFTVSFPVPEAPASTAPR